MLTWNTHPCDIKSLFHVCLLDAIIPDFSPLGNYLTANSPERGHKRENGAIRRTRRMVPGKLFLMDGFQKGNQ
jgi:hypothetical protein